MKKKFGLTKFCLVWQNLEFRQTDVWQNSGVFRQQWCEVSLLPCNNVWLVVNGAMRNAQQTIYRLYFRTFGMQCKGTTIWFWGRGGGAVKILFGQIIYFRHGLGREISFMWHGLGKIYFRVNISDDFSPIFIGNPIFWIKETDNSNGVPILCQTAFSSLSLPFFVRLKLF